MLSLLAMAVFILLVFSAGRINIFSDKADLDGDTAPAVSALRTYFVSCFFDISGVLGLMLAGALGLSGLKKHYNFCSVVFVLAAIVYFILSGRIGLDDFSDSDGEEMILKGEVCRKSALKKDTVREIRHSDFSIFLIVLLGCGFFCWYQGDYA